MLRRGETRLSPPNGRWHLGHLSYDLYRYRDCFFVTYPGVVQDFAEKESVRINASALEAKLGAPGFVEVMQARIK